MIKLKKMMALAVGIGLLSICEPAQAQNHNPGGGMRQEMKQRTEELKAKLKLTPEQTLMFDEIMKRNREEARNQMMALPDDALPMERNAIAKKSIEKADTEIMEILDSEQQAMYKAERDIQKGKMKERRKEKMKQNEKVKE